VWVDESTLQPVNVKLELGGCNGGGCGEGGC
jgi:hypothetical protein